MAVSLNMDDFRELGKLITDKPTYIQKLGKFMKKHNMTPDSVPSSKSGSTKYIIHPISVAARASNYGYGQGYSLREYAIAKSMVVWIRYFDHYY